MLNSDLLYDAVFLYKSGYKVETGLSIVPRFFQNWTFNLIAKMAKKEAFNSPEWQSLEWKTIIVQNGAVELREFLNFRTLIC